MRISCIKHGDTLRITAIDGHLPDGPCELFTGLQSNSNKPDATFPFDDESWDETLETLTRKDKI